MHAAFGTVVWIVCGVAGVAAVVALLLSSRTWEDFGKRGLTPERDLARSTLPGSAAADQEREDEIRQLLGARNARRLRRGEAPLDVEREIAKLDASPVDPALRAEIRDLVIARNVRRVRAGKPALDVDSEVEREILRLTSPGRGEPSGGGRF